MAVIPNATISSTRQRGTAVYTGRRVQFTSIDPTTQRVTPSGDPVAAELYDTPDAVGSYLVGDVVDVLTQGPVGTSVQPIPHKFNVAAVEIIASRRATKAVRLLLVGTGR